MNESGREQLHSLLFSGEGELVNVKFFPGNAADLTPDTLAAAAARMLRKARDAFEAGEPSSPPSTGMAKRQLVG
jgi:hypothetical protein